MKTASLRLRLFALILCPLVLMAVLLGYWRFNVAQRTAEELFDRSLLSAALAISRDVAISDGDALLRSTRDLIRDSSGGEVFYHATGPGGIYVTGYAYPPVVAKTGDEDPYKPVLFEAIYRSEAVRVLRITERVTSGNLTGDTTVTVWQRMSDRHAFAAQLAIRATGLIGGLLLTLALVVWFGVKFGLRPLTDLQNAISLRSPDDLRQIKRPVPVETRGIVQVLNRLFGQVETSIEAHQTFISNAAHQLRNPAAAVQSMAEALQKASNESDRETRLNELVSASRHSASIAGQLLSLERLRSPGLQTQFEIFDLKSVLEEVGADIGTAILSKNVEFEVDLPLREVLIKGDRFFVAEAIKNLIDNALTHGGSKLTRIRLDTTLYQDMIEITVTDNGLGLSPEEREMAFSRFSQAKPTHGSGLGLAIVWSVAQQHGGDLRINSNDSGASLTLSMPIVPSEPGKTVGNSD